MLSRSESARLEKKIAASGTVTIAVAIAVIIGLVCLVSWIKSYDPVKAETAQLQAEYDVKFASLVSKYSNRVPYGYKMRPGDGVDDALLASGVLKELGPRNSTQYQACRKAVEKMNRYDSDWPGHTMYVPSGKASTACTASTE